MSALPLPASPLPLPGKLQSQPSNAAPADNGPEQMPFASVLHQKVAAGNAKGEQSPASQGTEPDTQETAAAAAAEVTAAQALVSGEYAQNALQNLLPWLQSVQGQAAQGDSQETLGAELADTLPTDASPQATLALSLLAGQTTTPAPTGTPGTTENKTGLRPVLENRTLPAVKAGAKAETASETANLAASTETALSADTPVDAQPDLSQPSHLASQTIQTSRFDAALQQASEQMSTQAASKSNGELVRLQAALGSPQWQNELGDQVHLMSRQNDSRAELVLTPPQLGRIEISLSISGDQASAMFVSANPEVRTALEGAMDRLREVLAGNGITLGQTHVGAESSGQSASGEHGGNRQGNLNGTSGTENNGIAATAWTRHSNNMLDVFA